MMIIMEKDVLQELDLNGQQNLSKRYQELEVNSKADVKVLVKEVEALRISQTEMKQQLNEALKRKSAIEILLQEERQKNEHLYAAWRKLLEECTSLHNQRVNLLLAEVQLLSLGVGTGLMTSKEKYALQELDLKRQQLEDLSKRYQELEVKSKADVKFLVKEIEALRSSQKEMEHLLNETHTGKEILLLEERQKNEHMNATWRKLPEECASLHNQLQGCKVNALNDDE